MSRSFGLAGIGFLLGWELGKGDSGEGGHGDCVYLEHWYWVHFVIIVSKSTGHCKISLYISLKTVVYNSCRPKFCHMLLDRHLILCITLEPLVRYLLSKAYK